MKGEPVEAVARNLPKSETRQRLRQDHQAVLVARLIYFIPQAIILGGIDKVHSAIEVTAPA